MHVESLWIQIRTWLEVGKQLAAIAVFLIGAGAIAHAKGYWAGTEATYLGVDIPGLAGLSPRATLLYGGFFAMMVGLGLAYRWTISDRHGLPHY